MKLIDANILIYAYDASRPLHNPARRWLEETLSGMEPVRLAWMTVLALLRIMTNRRIYENPYSLSEASTLVGQWLAQPCVDILQPSVRHWSILADLLQEGQAAGPLVMDAHLEALAIEYGATLYSTDKDFTRFAKLKLINPLIASC